MYVHTVDLVLILGGGKSNKVTPAANPEWTNTWKGRKDKSSSATLLLRNDHQIWRFLGVGHGIKETDEFFFAFEAHVHERGKHVEAEQRITLTTHFFQMSSSLVFLRFTCLQEANILCKHSQR